MKAAPLLLIGLLYATCAAGDAVPQGETPLELATSALDTLRDEKHKKEIRIVWPEAAEARAPADCDVLLITGSPVFSCTWLRIFRSDGGPVVCERVKATRNWYLNPPWVYDRKGESSEALRGDVDPAAFARAWTAAHLLLHAKAEWINPPTTMVFGARGCSSTDAMQEWIALRDSKEGDRYFRYCIRGQTYQNEIQNFEELRVRAVRSLFKPLEPAPAQLAPFPLSDWSGFLEAELRSQLSELSPTGMKSHTWVLYESGLRILGEAGGEPAAELAKGVSERLRDADEKDPHMANWVRDESTTAMTKIRLRLHWNAAEALAHIHASPREKHLHMGLAQWIRDQYFERDSDGYYRVLLADLRSDNSRLLHESIGELTRLYPGSGLYEMRALLKAPDTEVAARAALSIQDYEPSHAESLALIERVASDPTASIPADARWTAKFARNQALERLCAQTTPAQHRWDSKRVHQQLAKAGEDGRIVINLISQAAILGDRLKEEEEIAALRSALNAPPTRGWLAAAEKLIELKDRASVTVIRERIKTLAANCNRDLSWKPDPDALYPWTDKYELERIEKAAAGLEASTAAGAIDRHR